MRKEEIEELFVTRKQKEKGQRKTTANICIQYGKVEVMVSIRCDQKYERKKTVDVHDQQHLQKTWNQASTNNHNNNNSNNNNRALITMHSVVLNEAKAKAKTLRPRTRPEPPGRGQVFEAEAQVDKWRHMATMPTTNTYHN